MGKLTVKNNTDKDELLKQADEARKFILEFSKKMGVITGDKVDVMSIATLIQKLSTKVREQECAYTLKKSTMTQSSIETFSDFLNLVKHGAKYIDIHVRRDAKEYVFQADFLKYIVPPKPIQEEAS